MEKTTLGPTKRWRYSEVTLKKWRYREVFFNNDKERNKSGPKKKWRYSEYEVIEGDVIEGFDCNLD